MTKQKKTSKYIPDQIFEEMSSKLKEEDGFEAELVEKLKGLYATGGLKKSDKIIEIIKPKEG
jgi:hypothetical protein